MSGKRVIVSVKTKIRFWKTLIKVNYENKAVWIEQT
jgi:hypothetical protein